MLESYRLMSSWKFSESNRLIIEVGSGYEVVSLNKQQCLTCPFLYLDFIA
jgi:hypothetical protein